MQKNYLLIAISILLLFGLILLFNPKEKSAPNNNTKDELNPVSSFSHSHGIAVDITDPNKVYIATHEGLFILMDDKDLYRIGNTQYDLMSFTSHPTEAQTFFSSGHSSLGRNIGFQKTTDGGISWIRVSDGLQGPVDFHAMTISQINPNIIYGFFAGRLQRSINGGVSWEYTKSNIAPISLSSDLEYENTLYASTQDGIKISKDGGETWQSLSSQLEGGFVTVFSIDPTNTYSLTFSERIGGMGKSIDGGITWQKIQYTFDGEIILYISFSKSESGIVYALTNKNSIYKSIDSGTSWKKIR